MNIGFGNNELHGCVVLCQVFTFSAGFFTLLIRVLNPSLFSEMGIWRWILIGMSLLYIVLQIFAILKVGLRRSFSFLGLVLKMWGGRSGK
jgi:hypothetical protein